MMHVALDRRLITPAEALKWIQEYRMPNERPLREWWVRELTERLVRDQWEPGLAKLHEVDGEWFRVDSQHRCHAIVAAGIPALMNIEYTFGSSWEAAKAAYNRTDAGVPRLMSDRLRMSGICKEEGLSVTQTRRVIAGLRFVEAGWKQPMRGSRSDPDEEIALVRQYGAAARGYFACLEGRKRAIVGPLTLSGPIGVGLTLFSRPPQEQALAAAFFTSVATDSGLVLHQPEHTLLALIREPATESAKKNRTTQYRQSPAYLARAIACAWNAWVEGRSLQYIRVDDVSAPIKLHHPALNQRRAA